MKIIEIKKNAIDMESGDWATLNKIAGDFSEVCRHCVTCNDCPLNDFCIRHESPRDFFNALMVYLDS